MLKSLKYDGTATCEDWATFLVKFEIMANSSNLSPQERRDYLCWCLTGAASRYGTNLIRHNKNISYDDMVTKMEQRFNYGNEAGTLQVQFQCARQSPNESTDEWADRLSSLADKAFRDVPEQYVKTQIITQFLQSLNDKDAGKSVSMLKPQSIEEACQLVKLSQHLDTSIYGGRRPDRHCADINERVDPYCQNVRTNSNTALPRQAKDQSTEQQLSQLSHGLMTLQNSTIAQFKELQHEIQKMHEYMWSPPEYKHPFKCYNCGEPGHISRHCQKPPKDRNTRRPRLRDDNKEDKREPLNQQGSDKEA